MAKKLDDVAQLAFDALDELQGRLNELVERGYNVRIITCNPGEMPGKIPVLHLGISRDSDAS